MDPVFLRDVGVFAFVISPAAGQANGLSTIRKVSWEMIVNGLLTSSETPGRVFPMVTTDRAAFIGHLCFFSSACVFTSLKRNLKILFLGLGSHIKTSVPDSLLGTIGF
jgi:hypothetical protein